MPPFDAQASAPRRIGLFVVIGILSAASSVAFVGLRPGGFLKTSDVGTLEALAPVQAKLGPIDACHIEYARRDKHGHRAQLEAIFIESCGDDQHVVVRVAPTWGRRQVGFEMKRSSPKQPWQILVEKDEVPFADLVGALDEYVPVVVETYAPKLAAIRAERARWQRETAARNQAEHDRKTRAPTSYPTK